MSMMTSTMLCAIEQHLKQIQNNTNPFTNVLVLLVGDLIQLLAICKHSFKTNELYCKKIHVSLAPWSNPMHHVLTISIRHAIHSSFLQFLNIIHIKKPTQNEIANTFTSCYIS